MLFWITIGFFIHWLVGIVAVGFVCGSSKISGGWKAKQAWEQFAQQGWKTMVFLTSLSLLWSLYILYAIFSTIFERKSQ